MSECISPLMLLANEGVPDTQKMSILAAALSNGFNLGPLSTNNECLSAVMYQSIRSIIRHFNTVNSSERTLLGKSAGRVNKNKG